jgi:hypothetical protein
MTIDWVAKALIVLLLFKPTSSWANEIYINQVGDDLVLEVVQDGANNYFQYCTNGNDSNCKDVDGNAHNQADGVASDDTTVKSNTVGDDNRVVVAHATGQNNTNENITNIDILGDRNNAQVLFSNHSYGSHNYSNQPWGGTKESNIDIDGDDNIVKVRSNSYGEAESNIKVTGDDNDVRLFQRSMNNVANIDVTNVAGPNTINVEQLGSSYQDTATNSYSLTQYCNNVNGCTVNVTQN